ncbi:hypothetical protein [Micromonospora sp. b486]|uniref:hypothetical protein n=1 Tax=Micromonospora sp. b486 TaxID=3053986 RepID=UPI00259CD239|nr:hypothetical protein [Micromonospora sp. b486]MDM4784602.1 hypothetical protein [Micromonospora sp. b486]
MPGSTPSWSSRSRPRSSRAIADGRLARERVEEAAGRTAALAAATGPADAPRPAVDASATPPRCGRYARRGRPHPRHRAPRGAVHATSTIAEGRVPWGSARTWPAGSSRPVPWRARPPEELRRLAGDRPVVLVGRHLHRLPGARELVERWPPRIR